MFGKQNWLYTHPIEELSYLLKVGLQASPTSPGVLGSLVQINPYLHLQQSLSLCLDQSQEVSSCQVLHWLVPEVLHSSTWVSIIYHLGQREICTYDLLMYVACKRV